MFVYEVTLLIENTSCVIWVVQNWDKMKYKLFSFAAERHQSSTKPKIGNSEAPTPQPEPTWVHEIFQGILTSETRCLNCETVRSL
jgi:hypothetical protein